MSGSDGKIRIAVALIGAAAVLCAAVVTARAVMRIVIDEPLQISGFPSSFRLEGDKTTASETPNLAPVEEQLASLADRIATLESGTGSERQVEGQIEAVAATLRAQATQVTRLENQPSGDSAQSADLAAEVASLESRVNDLRHDLSTIQAFPAPNIPTALAVEEGVILDPELTIASAQASTFDPATDQDEKPQWGPSRVIDGDANSQWKNERGDENAPWLEIELADERAITAVGLLPCTNCYPNFEDVTVVFPDGEGQKLHLTPRELQMRGWKRFPLIETRARSLKLVLHNRYPSSQLAIAEVVVYGR